MTSPSTELIEARARLVGADAREILRWSMQRFGTRLAIASSFSIDDCVVIDLAHAIDPAVRVFALDTGRLPEETYLTAERVRAKYGTTIEWQFPERQTVERLIRVKGLYSFRDSLEERHECCGIRKVQPLGHALAGLSAWVTGLRRAQSITRTDTGELELDAEHGTVDQPMAKVNPIISWSDAQVRSYAEEQRVPIHPLHDRGYPSIGCAPCTRAVAAGEHPRAGRWWWEDADKKECGLHPPR